MPARGDLGPGHEEEDELRNVGTSKTEQKEQKSKSDDIVDAPGVPGPKPAHETDV